MALLPARPNPELVEPELRRAELRVFPLPGPHRGRRQPLLSFPLPPGFSSLFAIAGSSYILIHSLPAHTVSFSHRPTLPLFQPCLSVFLKLTCPMGPPVGAASRVLQDLRDFLAPQLDLLGRERFAQQGLVDQPAVPHTKRPARFLPIASVEEDVRPRFDPPIKLASTSLSRIMWKTVDPCPAKDT